MLYKSNIYIKIINIIKSVSFVIILCKLNLTLFDNCSTGLDKAIQFSVM